MRIAVILIILLLASGTAVAGSADQPEVTDEAGDAMAHGVVPAPAAYEDLDVIAAWFTGETGSTLPLHIQVAGAWANRPNTAIEMVYETNGTALRAGFVHAVGLYTGPYVCPMDTQDGRGCVSVGGGWDAPDVVRVEIPRENLSDAPAGDEVLITSGGSYEFTTFFLLREVDVTPAGVPYALQFGADGRQAPDVEDVTENVTDEALDRTAVDATDNSGSNGGNEAPVPALLAVLAGLGAAASRRR